MVVPFTFPNVVRGMDGHRSHQIVHRGMLLHPTVVDHTEWIVCFLRDTQFCFELSGDLVRIFGYLPKSLNKLGPDPETENRE